MNEHFLWVTDTSMNIEDEGSLPFSSLEEGSLPVLFPLPLRARYDNNTGGVTTGRECDTFFDAVVEKIHWETVTHSGPDLYLQFCVWTFMTVEIEGTDWRTSI